MALDEAGRLSFQALQHRTSHPNRQIEYYAFDLLHLNGEDLTGKPLTERRRRLEKLIPGTGLRMSYALPGAAPDVVAAVRALRLEGVIAKRKQSIYAPGTRSTDWVKLKLERQQEFVIGGYRGADPSSLDALLVGYYEGKSLRFAGKVRAGLIPHTRRELARKLKPLKIAACPFADLPTTGSSRRGGGVTADEMRGLHWTKPMVVAQIRFVEWTAENRLRHAQFLGLRADKRHRDVHREESEWITSIPSRATESKWLRTRNRNPAEPPELTLIPPRRTESEGLRTGSRILPKLPLANRSL